MRRGKKEELGWGSASTIVREYLGRLRSSTGNFDGHETRRCNGKLRTGMPYRGQERTNPKE